MLFNPLCWEAWLIPTLLCNERYQYNGLDKGEYQRDPRGTERLLVWKGNNVCMLGEPAYLSLCLSLTVMVPLQWGEGGASQYPRGSNMSSFEVLDALIAHHSSRVSVSSARAPRHSCHSMGGQLVQRYSVLVNRHRRYRYRM